MRNKKADFLHHMKSSTHIWWQRPKIHTAEDEGKERKATWLELFYDLVYVAVIAQLSHKLSSHISWKELFEYVVLFLPVWWSWNWTTYYNDRFEVNDVRHRFFTVLSMIPIGVMAYSIHDAFGKTAGIFIWAYITNRAILIYMWFSAGRVNDQWTYAMTRRLVLGLVVSEGFWVISAFVPLRPRLVLWGLAFLLDNIAPITTLDVQKKMPKVSVSHLPERFGLLVLLAIAESVVGLVSGLLHVHHITLAHFFMGIFGLFLAFALWWVYFDQLAVRPFKQNIWYILVWCHLHMPLVLGLTAMGASSMNIVAQEGVILSQPARWLICGSAAFVLMIMALIGMMLEPYMHIEGRKLQFHAHLNREYFIAKMIASVLIVCVGLFGKSLSAIPALFLLFIIISSQAVQGLYIWVKTQTSP